MGARPTLLALCFGMLVTGPVGAAGPPACAGKDLIADLKRDDPAEYQRLVAAAASITNGGGLLWRVEKDGAEPSFLFGTMHVTDDRLAELPAAATAAIAESETVALEISEIVGDEHDRDAMQAVIATRGLDETGRGLDIFPPVDREVFARALIQRNISVPTAQRMKPWMLLSLVSAPGCELARIQAGLPSVDERIGREGQRVGAEVVGLESVEEQVDALASIGSETAAQLALGIARLGHSFDDVFETMVGLYRRREVGLFFGDLDIVGVPPDDAGAFARFMEILVDRRNAVMAERAIPLIDAGRSFIAVGALHLVGDRGLVELLRKAGYTVTVVW